MLAVLIATNQVANVLAGRAVPAVFDLGIHVGAEFLGKRHVHGRHTLTLRPHDKPCHHLQVVGLADSVARGRSVARRATFGVVTTTITQRELRNSSGDIMRRLDEGETFIVTRAGKPVGELSPLRRERFVTAETVAALFQRAPAIDADRFRADLDNVADPGIDPRV